MPDWSIASLEHRSTPRATRWVVHLTSHATGKRREFEAPHPAGALLAVAEQLGGSAP